MSGIPYLGSKISLISKSEIRYEGILVDVNPQESTITFEQVRFFGTEGRRPGDEIAPMDRVFDCVVFRSADIKDLQVYETPAASAAAAAKEPEIPDPAIVSFASAAKSNDSNANTSGFQYKSKSAATSESSSGKVANDYASIAAQQSTNKSSTSSSFNSASRSRSQNQINPRPHHHQHQNQNRGIVVPQSEFDFSQSNAKFEESTDEKPELPTGPSYNKSLSFFDDISCQTNSESSANRNERSLNMETFGQAAPHRRYGHRGGRGGRGGYNNRYRGGNYYHHNSNNNNNSNNSNNANNNQSN